MSLTSIGSPAPHHSPGDPARRPQGELQRLQAADLATFKRVMAEVACWLKAAAGQSSGEEACTLARQASDFEQSAQTGQLPWPP